MTTLDYDDFQAIAQQLSNRAEIAELDGLMAGMLICGPTVPAATLLKSLRDFLQDDEAKQFDALQQQTLAQLTAGLAQHAQELHAVDEMEWMPLLPPEDLGLDAQLTGLSFWCAGFIHGIGIALGGEDGPMKDSELPGDCQELLSDLAEISRVEVEGAAGNDAENDYEELLEYTRTAVFTCAIEFSHWREDDGHGAKGNLAPEAGTLQ